MTFFYYYLFDFLFGGFAYCTTEILWRGRTHYTMFFAGGIIFAALCCFDKLHPKTPLILKCLIGALIITAVEFVFGIVFNIILNMNVWDYSKMPLNILGQICLPFTLIWVAFSFIIFKYIIPHNPYG